MVYSFSGMLSCQGIRMTSCTLRPRPVSTDLSWSSAAAKRLLSGVLLQCSSWWIGVDGSGLRFCRSSMQSTASCHWTFFSTTAAIWAQSIISRATSLAKRSITCASTMAIIPCTIYTLVCIGLSCRRSIKSSLGLTSPRVLKAPTYWFICGRASFIPASVLTILAVGLLLQRRKTRCLTNPGFTKSQRLSQTRKNIFPRVWNDRIISELDL